MTEQTDCGCGLGRQCPDPPVSLNFCNACQASPAHGYCKLPGCPMPRPETIPDRDVDSIFRPSQPETTVDSDIDAVSQLVALHGSSEDVKAMTRLVSAARQALAHNQEGGR